MIALTLAMLLSAAPPSSSDPREVYLEAYQLKDTDPDRAKELFKWVLEHTPPSDDDHDKAARWLKDLRNKHTRKKR